MTQENKLNYSLTHLEATEYLKKVVLKSARFFTLGFGIIAILAMLASLKTNDMVYAETFFFGYCLATALISWRFTRKLLNLPTLGLSNEVTLTENALLVHARYPNGNHSEKLHTFSYDYFKQIVELPNTFNVECHALNGRPQEYVIIPKRIVDNEMGQAFMTSLRERLAKKTNPC